MSFEISKTAIDGVLLIKPKVFRDDRGIFMECYKKSQFDAAGIDADFIQDNHSVSKKGVLRGLHYQLPPYAQGKLVRCIRGAIYDVAVDIRKSSANFGRWTGCKLSARNKKMLWIPPGFAHGFLALTNSAEMVYKVTGGEYHQPSERSIVWNDADIGIQWPAVEVVTLADKDAEAPCLRDAEVFE